MPSSYGPTHDTGGGTGSTIRRRRTPAALRSDRRLQIWIALPAASLLFVVTVASTSLWNYHGLSLQVPTPTSDISALETPVQIGSIARPSIASEWEFDSGEPLSAPATYADGSIYIVSGDTMANGRHCVGDGL